ncbi:hypothetical protein BS78_10G194600 [Paspalum vaginatum]|nr:hypothetical protein BS78_10G194600 [Paspalum vaginatum]
MAVSMRRRAPWLGLLFLAAGALLLQLTLGEEQEGASATPLGHNVGEGHGAMALRNDSLVHGSVVAKGVDIVKRQQSVGIWGPWGGGGGGGGGRGDGDKERGNNGGHGNVVIGGGGGGGGKSRGGGGNGGGGGGGSNGGGGGDSGNNGGVGDSSNEDGDVSGNNYSASHLSGNEHLIVTKQNPGTGGGMASRRRNRRFPKERP